MTCDSTKCVGKRGGKYATARRKGGRNINKTPPTTIVDRQSLVLSSEASLSTVTSSLSATTIGVAFNPVQASRPQVAWPQVLPVQSSSTPQPLFNQTPRLHSCFAPPRPQIWPQIPTQPSPTQLSPTNTPQPSFTANFLQLCPPLVRSCYGCSQTLKPGGTIANPPHDLVIISQMKRSYRDPSTLEMRSREGNVYFHVHESCIQNNYYVPKLVSIPHGLLTHLKTEHLHFLRQFGLHV